MIALLNSSSTVIITFVVAFSIIICILTIGLVIWIIYRNRKKTEERLKRLPDVDYTQILRSSGGESGSIITYGNNKTNFGTYSSAPSTKFLVVYLSGEREIVTVLDNSKLCKEYLLKLKNND